MYISKIKIRLQIMNKLHLNLRKSVRTNGNLIRDLFENNNIFKLCLLNLSIIKLRNKSIQINVFKIFMEMLSDNIQFVLRMRSYFSSINAVCQFKLNIPCCIIKKRNSRFLRPWIMHKYSFIRSVNFCRQMALPSCLFLSWILFAHGLEGLFTLLSLCYSYLKL